MNKKQYFLLMLRTKINRVNINNTTRIYKIIGLFHTNQGFMEQSIIKDTKYNDIRLILVLEILIQLIFTNHVFESRFSFLE